MGRELQSLTIGFCLLCLICIGILIHENNRRKKLIQALKESELENKLHITMFERALARAPVFIWLYDIQKDRLIQLSDAHEKYTKSKILDNFYQMVIDYKMVHEDSIATFYKLHQDMKEGKEFSEGELLIKTESGEYEWYHLCYEAVYNEVGKATNAIGISENINIQKNQDHLAYEKAESLQEICDYTFETEFMDAYTIDVSTKEVIMYYANGNNVGRLPIIDYEKQLEKSYRFIHPEDLANYKEHTQLDSMIKIMEEHDGVNVCTYRYQLYKEMKWARVKCVYLPRNKDKILVLTKDISIEHVQEINAKTMLEKALKDANQAVQAKQDFLSNMSHEIRTPLSGIKGMLSLLLEQPEYKDNSYLKKAYISTKHLTGLLNDILDMAKIDSGTIEIHKEFMLMDQLVQYIDAIIRPMAQEKNISFEYRHNYLFDGIYIDAGRLNQIIINLLSNAVKYTMESGSVRFKICHEQIEDHLLRVYYVIEDTGVGMSEDFLKKAFLAFEQENYNYGVMGTGLGLTITKRLVELMGGEITIESELGVGTKVTVAIDSYAANLDELPEEARTALQQVEPVNHKFRGKRALVVEDNDINMEIVELSLEALEIEVEKACNGEEAVRMFEKSTPKYYDIIFMDIMMPVMDGLKATQLIRSFDREDSKSIAIVAMTANAFLEDVNKSLESGMNYHLIKPFDKTKLLRILFRVIK